MNGLGKAYTPTTKLKGDKKKISLTRQHRDLKIKKKVLVQLWLCGFLLLEQHQVTTGPTLRRRGDASDGTTVRCPGDEARGERYPAVTV